ncbi:imidazole glycerol phosphate synthase subunit HisF [Hypnocyclicus thermotrophus]|uniref:Imidazole glycerol phosphate synthase subunit HisF n=1 Tax=Hypnocyclicus thermotrophus TaxID=1627895 RepID=A0AA46DZ81_9FUSO|nr:imidazole glycerol phosphate synthase subunit HisF [Hypnocyclicus thermotrophus]
MLTKRIIPCFDVRDGRVVKGKKFQDIKDVEDPVVLAKKYNALGADELVFYDITASFEERKLFTNILEKVASEVFIPLTVGGGINSLEDFSRVLNVGADKVSVNSGAIKNPNLIKKAAEKFGSQCVVLSMDIKKVENQWRVFSKGGREDTGIDAIEWAITGEQLGAGELVINSMDTDGVKAGFDLDLLRAISEKVEIPIIASGGAGTMKHFKEVFDIPGVDAGLAASVFHYGEIEIPNLKKYLKEQGVNIRMTK